MPDSATTLETASRGRSWGRTCCLGCFLPLFAMCIALFVGIRVLSGPGSQQISALPPNYPADLPLYRLSDARTMTYLPGRAKGKLIEFISAPAKWLGLTAASSTYDRMVKTYAAAAAGMDRVTVTWTGLDAKPADIAEYYTKLFASAGLSNQAINDEKTGAVAAVGTRSDAIVELYLKNAPETPGIDEMTVTVDYIPK